MSAGPQLAPLPAEWQRDALDGDGRWSLGADTAPWWGESTKGPLSSGRRASDRSVPPNQIGRRRMRSLTTIR